MPYRGGRRDKASLRYEKEVYTPEGAKSLTERELRKEYSRLRSIARKRLERFEGTEWTDTQIYKLNVGVYKPLKEIKSDRELRYLFSSLGHFIMRKDSSVSGLKEERENFIRAMHDRGYDFVNKTNYREFTNFMEYARVANLNRIFDSKRIADFFQAAEKKRLSREQLYKSFRAWTRKQKKLKKIQNINPRNSAQYRRDVD